MLPRDLQEEVELRFSKKNIRKAITAAFMASDEIVQKIQEGIQLLETYRNTTYGYDSKNLRMEQFREVDLEALVINTLVLVLPMNVPTKLTEAVGQLVHMTGLSEKREGVVTIAEVLTILCETDIFDMFQGGEEAIWFIRSNYDLPQKVRAFIDQTKYLPPMVCEPRIVRSNYDSGYLTHKDSLILGHGTFHDGDICLDSINRYNQVPLSLDVDMLRTYSEVPKAFIEDPKHKLQWEKMARDSIKVFADLVKQGNRFHLTHKVDKRGRTYCQGYHCSYQGNSFRKAIINLADKEVVDGI